MENFESRGLEFGKGKAAKPPKEEKEPKVKKEKKGHGRRPKEIHLRHVKGGFIAKHIHEQALPGEEHEEHLIPAEHEGDLDGLHSHLEDAWGGPNKGESELSPEVIHGKSLPGV
jgi:hypothetical protein